MKKILTLIFIMISVVTLICCAPKPDDNGSVLEPATIADYFPVRENIRYIYEGYGNEFAAYHMTVDYVEEGRIQQRINNGGTELVQVYNISEDKVSMVYSRGETYFRQNFFDYDSGDTGEIILKEPIEEGASWTSGESHISTITNISADIETPSGKYKALEITTEGPSGKAIDYYVKEIGLVKTINIGEGYEVSSALSAIEENAVFIQNVRFYYPNIDDGKYYYMELPVEFMTNDITREILGNIYKEPVDSKNMPIGKVFSINTEINSLYLNEDGMVYIDLNKAFLEEMNAGSGYEGMILQSIANTFGGYFNSDRVILTIENELYESGHIAFQKGEYITVDVENVEELR